MANQQPIIIKKKKVSGHGHHGGAWKVAYADFVTAMMAFFMVMWIMGMSEEVRMGIQGYFRDPLGFSKNEPSSKMIMSLAGQPSPPPGQSPKKESSPLERQEKEAKALSEQIKRAISTDGDLQNLLKNLDFEVTKEGLRIELVEATYAGFFQSGSAEMNETARKFVRRIAPLLERTGRRLVIEGHTDAEPYPSKSYTNWDLSADRALALRRQLSFSGIPTDRFQAIRGLADTQLKDTKNPYSFKNRRVTILLPFSQVGDTVVDLPKDKIRERVNGIFRQPVEIAPSGGMDPMTHRQWDRFDRQNKPFDQAEAEHAHGEH